MSDLNNTSGLPPKNYLVESILATIFCCWPFGIYAIIKASSVNTKFAAGDIEGANLAAAEAKKWTTITAVVGLVVGVLYIVAMVALGGFAAMSEGGF